MYNIILTFIIIISLQFSLNGQVGINTTTPNVNAALDITSTTKGLLPPRMTEAQRNAISSPVPTGLIVWCTDCGIYGQLQAYNGSF